MLLILLIWCYLTVTFYNFGFAFKKLVNIKELDTTLTIVLGMFGVTLFASFWAVFGRINYEFQIALVLIQLLIVIKYKSELASVCSFIFNKSKEIDIYLKTFFLLTLFVILFQSAGSASFVDNETYYLQTIKWLNEYGFVPGLANLHIFFGQTSGWHILQSAFSFSYLTDNCNDLNGFCLLLGIAFSSAQLDSYFKKGNLHNLSMGLFTTLMVLLLPFSNVPSPDLAVIVISLLLFSFLIRSNEMSNSDSLTILALLAFFIVYIKISALPILLLPLLYVALRINKKQSKTIPTLLIGAVVVVLFVIKNIILTGYPLYPSSLFADYFTSGKTIPNALYEFWWSPSKHYGFVFPQNQCSPLSTVEILLQWISESWVIRSIALILLSLFILVPFAITKSKNKRAFWIIYVTMIVQILFLILTAPQFRFLLSFILFFGLTLLSFVLVKKKPIYISLYIGLIFASLYVIFPIALGINHSRVDFYPQAFSIDQIVIPKSNSNLRATFSKKTKGNLYYNSPDEHSYIWVNGDGNLPCVNIKQIEYFEEKLGYYPQLRGAALAEGFYSKKTVKR